MFSLICSLVVSGDIHFSTEYFNILFFKIYLVRLLLFFVLNIHVLRKLLWKAFGNANDNLSVSQIIRYIFLNNKWTLKIRSNLSNEFCNTKDVLRGCIISPTLFRIYIDIALKEWSRNCKWKGLKADHSCYVHSILLEDDQVVIIK